METDKSKVIVLGSVALGALLIAGMGVLMFGKDPTATPRPVPDAAVKKPAEAPALELKADPAPGPADAPASKPAPAASPSAAKLKAQAPRDVDLEPKSGEEPAKPPSTPSALTAQDQWNNERNAYTIQFQEKLNELEYRRMLVANGLPIERARHEALIQLYKDSIASMQNGDATNLAAEAKRVQEEEKQIMRGARDSQLHP